MRLFGAEGLSKHGTDESIKRAVPAALHFGGVGIVLRISFGENRSLRVRFSELGIETRFEPSQLAAKIFGLRAEIVGHGGDFFIGELAGPDDKRSQAAGIGKRCDVA